MKDTAKKPSLSGFGSVFAQLNDGMCLAFSTFGATGDPEGGKSLALYTTSGKECVAVCDSLRFTQIICDITLFKLF